MKSLFPGYHRPTEEEFHQMWQECIFAFDASMLLNIYRYPSETLEGFFNILERLKDRIWIPHQVATEFYENREVVIAYQLNIYNEIEKRFNESYGKLENQLAGFKRHFSIKPEQLLQLIQSGIQNAKESLKKERESYPDMSSSDPLRDRLVELFASNVGSPFDNKRLSEIYLEAEQRFNFKQPPGYNDAKKPFPEKYGDVVVWFQLIEYAKTKQRPLILVTDDRKEDWWLKKDGGTVAPRPELTNEIQAKAGIKFYMYHSEQFIKYAQEFLDLEDQQVAVQGVEEIGKQDEAYQREIDYSVSPSWINLRAFENARLFDNSLIRQAVEAARAFDNPLIRQAIEQARRFDNPLIRQAIEQARKFDNPLMRQAIENVRLFDNSLMRQAVENARLLDNLHIRQTIEGTRWLDNSHIRQAVEAARLWQRNHLSGQSISRDIYADISPKRLSDLQSSESSKDVKVEVLLNTEVYGSSEDETVEDVDDSDKRSESQPYEFNNYPLTATLVHRSDSPRSFETLHRLRKPTFDEWEEWSLKIERSRRYLSPAEIDEHNARKGEYDEDATEIWEHFYGEWEASERFYNKLILEIAGVRLNEDDKFPVNQFREFAPELIENLRISKVNVITKLYKCYCGLETSVSSDNDEQRINQNIYHNSSSFDVIHILRKPTEDESYAFRTNIVKGYFSTDEDNQEIIELKLNLSTAVEFYNKLLINIENATVSGQPFTAETRNAFLEAINPVYKLRVLEPLFDVNAWYFKIDDWRIP